MDKGPLAMIARTAFVSNRKNIKASSGGRQSQKTVSTQGAEAQIHTLHYEASCTQA